MGGNPKLRPVGQAGPGMCNLKKLRLDRRARLRAASESLQLKAEGEIRLGRGKEKVKAGAPNPHPFRLSLEFPLPFHQKNQFSRPGGGRVARAAAVRGADS